MSTKFVVVSTLDDAHGPFVAGPYDTAQLAAEAAFDYLKRYRSELAEFGNNAREAIENAQDLLGSSEWFQVFELCDEIPTSPFGVPEYGEKLYVQK